MINKQNLWFITLFSLIIILGIYYISMDDDDLKVLSTPIANKEVVEVQNSNILVALRVEENEKALKEIETCQNTLLDATTTIEEKNDAYVALQTLSNKKSEKEKIEKLIIDKFKYDNFVKINADNINIIIANKEHSNKIANNIIREVQNLYKERKYITIKFE